MTKKPHEEDVLATLIGRYAAAIDQGEPVDLDALIRENPEYESEIRATVGTLQALDGLEPQTPQDTHQKVIGEFQLLREIGRGGMGIVYEAVQMSIGRRVALKVLPFAALADDQRLERFKNEIRAAGLLHHPNIVPVYSVGVDRGVHYFAMQLIEGSSLQQLLQEITVRNGDTSGGESWLQATEDGDALRLNHSVSKAAETTREVQNAITTQEASSPQDYFRTVAKWIGSTAEALAYAHENGILHRDVKPGNLLLDKKGHLWVVDFGLARIEQDASVTMTGDILGTLRYMAPEQALAKRVLIDHRADIYSLGATLYELLTKQPVFSGENREELIKQIIFDSPTPPRELNKEIPRDLETIVLKAIAKEPRERYESAQDLGDDLKCYLESRPIKAKPPTRLQRLTKWCGRNRTLVSIASFALLIGLVTVAWLVNRNAAILASAKAQANAARSLSEAQRYDVAEREIVGAASILERALWVPGSLNAYVDQLTISITEQRSANRVATDLGQRYASITAEIYSTPPVLMKSLHHEIDSAIQLYDLTGNEPLSNNSEFSVLLPQQQKIVKNRLVELLYAWALTGIDQRHLNQVSLLEAHTKAVRAFQSLEKLTRPFPAARLWQASSLRSLGHNVEADKLEQNARELKSESAVEWFLLGEYQYYNGDFTGAAESLQLALQKDPRNFLALLSLALTHDKLKREELRNTNEERPVLEHDRHVESLCTGALAVNSNCMLAYVLRAYARDGLGTPFKLKLSKLDLDAAQQIAPDHYEVISAKATFAGRAGRLDECLELLEQAEESIPQVLPGFYYWYASWILQADSNLMSDEVRRLQAIDKFTITLNSLAAVYKSGQGSLFRFGHFDKHSMRLSALLRRGMLNRAIGREKDAVADLERVLTQEGHNATQQFQRAIAHLLLENSQAANEILGTLEPEKVRRDSAVEEVCLLALASADKMEFMAKLVPQIPQQLRDDIPVDHKWTHWLNKEGITYFHRGEYNQAIALFKKACDLSPEKAVFQLNLAQSYATKGDYVKAIEVYRTTMSLEPTFPQAYSKLADCYAATGDFQRAIDSLSQAIELDPTATNPCWLYRGLCQVKLGLVDEYQAGFQSSNADIAFESFPTSWFTLASVDWGVDSQTLLGVARARVTDLTPVPNVPNDKIARHGELGGLLFRLEKLEEARIELQTAIRGGNAEVHEDQLSDFHSAIAACFLAMTQARLADLEESESWIQRVRVYLNGAKSLSKFQRLHLSVLVEEATTLRQKMANSKGSPSTP